MATDPDGNIHVAGLRGDGLWCIRVGKDFEEGRQYGRIYIIDNWRRNSKTNFRRAASFSNDAANRFTAWAAA
jgi:hypothetical protein